ncbi:hypothetical protein K438DRAFT_1948113 [Mycena galopus ATCC 62051]|nr:hypothetical protein K438DRAFT_1948113 [Mycena galopus ATCC 62051]
MKPTLPAVLKVVAMRKKGTFSMATGDNLAHMKCMDTGDVHQEPYMSNFKDYCGEYTYMWSPSSIYSGVGSWSSEGLSNCSVDSTEVRELAAGLELKAKDEPKTGLTTRLENVRGRIDGAEFEWTSTWYFLVKHSCLKCINPLVYVRPTWHAATRSDIAISSNNDVHISGPVPQRLHQRFRLFALAFPFMEMSDLGHGNAAERQARGSFQLRNLAIIQRQNESRLSITRAGEAQAHQNDKSCVGMAGTAVGKTKAQSLRKLYHKAKLKRGGGMPVKSSAGYQGMLGIEEEWRGVVA